MHDICETNAAPHPLLRPVVERNEPRGPRAWVVRVAALDAHKCCLYAPTKREAQTWTEGDLLRRWADHAAHCLAMEHKIAPAPAQPSACDRWHVEAWGDPGVWGCGRAPAGDLGNEADLVRFRLGWSKERYSASFDRWCADNDVRNVAWQKAVESLAAADLTPEEAAAMNATPETIGYYRMTWRLDDLRRRHHLLAGRELGAWWSSEAPSRTCWATAAADAPACAAAA